MNHLNALAINIVEIVKHKHDDNGDSVIDDNNSKFEPTITL